MRVKIRVKAYELEKLEYGIRYYMAYGGVTYGEEFIYTRKNRFELCEYRTEGDKHIKVSSYWISRRKLKQILNSGCIHWMSQYN